VRAAVTSFLQMTRGLASTFSRDPVRIWLFVSNATDKYQFVQQATYTEDYSFFAEISSKKSGGNKTH